jgi:hypothetical protein
MGNEGTLINLLSNLHHQTTVVAVEGSAAIGMGQGYEIAIAAVMPAREDDPPGLGGDDWSPYVVGNVDALVHSAPTPAISRCKYTLGGPYPALG